MKGYISMIVLVASGILAAQTPGSPPDADAMRAATAAYNRMPDTVGTGKYPALKEMVPSLPDHVIYRPADLSRLGGEKLGVVAWGNGGCSPDGASGRLHLAEIASHGYLAIANGRILSGPGAPAQAAPSQGAPAAIGATAPRPIPTATEAAGLREAIDWALAENARVGSPYFGRINPQWIAVSGWSCGGLQALQIAAEPRVRAVVIHNSGVLTTSLGGTLPADMNLGKDALEKLHTPVIYILGGPTDIAYPNGMDDFNRIDTVPALVANLDVGHGGTFMEPNGGRAASVAVSWLDWQMKGNKQAAKRFTGANCGLCQDSAWKVERKRMDAGPR